MFMFKSMASSKTTATIEVAMQQAERTADLTELFFADRFETAIPTITSK